MSGRAGDWFSGISIPPCVVPVIHEHSPVTYALIFLSIVSALNRPDTVILSGVVEPKAELYNACKELVAEVYTVGDV